MTLEFFRSVGYALSKFVKCFKDPTTNYSSSLKFVIRFSLDMYIKIQFDVFSTSVKTRSNTTKTAPPEVDVYNKRNCPLSNHNCSSLRPKSREHDSTFKLLHNHKHITIKFYVVRHFG